MNELRAFVRKICLNFWRDKTNVGISVLAVIVIILIYQFFMKDIITDSIRAMAPTATGLDNLTNTWMLGGMLAVVPVVVTAGSFFILINDKTSGRLEDILLTSVSPAKIMMGYVLSSFLIGAYMCVITFTFITFYLIVIGCPLSLGGMAISLFISILGAFVCAVTVYTLTCWLKSHPAFTGLFGIIISSIGFLSAVYVPVKYLVEPLRVLSALIPVSHIASILRSTMGGIAFDESFKETGLEDQMAVNLGYKLELFGIELDIWGSLLLIVIMTGIIFLIGYEMTKYNCKRQ